MPIDGHLFTTGKTEKILWPRVTQDFLREVIIALLCLASLPIAVEFTAVNPSYSETPVPKPCQQRRPGNHWLVYGSSPRELKGYPDHVT